MDSTDPVLSGKLKLKTEGTVWMLRATQTVCTCFLCGAGREICAEFMNKLFGCLTAQYWAFVIEKGGKEIAEKSSSLLQAIVFPMSVAVSDPGLWTEGVNRLELFKASCGGEKLLKHRLRKVYSWR